MTKELTLFVMAVLLSRSLLLIFLGAALDGREFTDDIDMLQEIARHPLQLLTGETKYAQHPPLLGVVEWIFFEPVDLFTNDFYNLRIVLIFYDVVAAALLWLALNGSEVTRRERILLGLTYLILPSQWMSSVVMAQDEVIAAAFLVGVLLCVSKGQNISALLVASLGVAAGKIFIILPLIALILLLPTPSIVKRLVLGSLPMILAYGVQFFSTVTRIEDVPLASFQPTAPFSVSLWVWLSLLLNLNVVETLRYSTILGLLASLVPIALVLLRRYRSNTNSEQVEISTDKVAALFYSVLAWFFTFFYHVNPEYLTLLSICALLMRPRPAFLVAHVTLTGVAWLVNFAYGIVRVTESTRQAQGKAKFAKLYQDISPVDAHALYETALAAGIVLILVLAVWSTVIALSQRTHLTPVVDA